MLKSLERWQVGEMIYVSGGDHITKRRVKILKVDNDSFTAYCFLRQSTRTFKFENILAFIPVAKERKVI